MSNKLLAGHIVRKLPMQRTEFGSARKSLAIIGGPYKSGTSAFCELIERNGYANPAHLTSSVEYGHGLTHRLYLTRECLMARNINYELVDASIHGSQQIRPRIVEYLCSMFEILGNRLVVKDPLFQFTAPHWMAAAASISDADVNLILLRRERKDVFRSWSNSAFLTGRMRSDPSLFDKFFEPQETDFLVKFQSVSAQIDYVDYSFVLNNHLASASMEK